MLIDIFRNTYSVILEAAPYVLLGTLFAGILRVFLQTEKLPQFLTQRTTGSVVKASLLGVPLPLCSCSVLPVALELRRKGASKGATSSFLISTPQTGVDSILLSFALLNPVFAVVRVVASFITGLFAGIVQNFLDRGEASTEDSSGSCGQPKTSCCCAKEEPVQEGLGLWQRILNGQRYAFFDLLPTMTKFYVIGLLATGLFMTFVPQGALEGFVGGGIIGMLGVAALGIVFYICASAATPFAAVLVMQGMSPGTALVLLLAGPATSLASLAVVQSILGLRGITAYLGTIFVFAILFGLGLDALYSTGLVSMAFNGIGHAHDHQQAWKHVIAVSVIVFLTIANGARFVQSRKKAKPTSNTTDVNLKPRIQIED